MEQVASSLGVTTNGGVTVHEDRIAGMEMMLAEVRDSVRKIRSYMFWSTVMTVVFFVLPLVAAVAAIPWMIKTLTGVYSQM